MESYEVILRTINFSKPPRIGFHFEQIGVSDYLYVGNHILLKKMDQQSLETPGKILLQENLFDEFGTIWLKKTNLRQIYIIPVKPVLNTWDEFKFYRFPDANNTEIYKDIREKINENKGKFVFAKIPGIFQRVRFLRGFENTMLDFALYPDELKKLINLVLEYIIEMLKNYKKFDGIHGIRMEEDWGAQSQPFIHRSLFREFFFEAYKALAKFIHSNGWYFCMHSDGKINIYMDDFINSGVNIIGLEQPRVVGIKEISEYRGKVCFEGSVDTQFSLPTDDYDLIRNEAKEILENWCTKEGGFVAVCNHSSYLGVTKKSIECSYEAFREYDIIRKNC
jgi:hypothetical protein